MASADIMILRRMLSTLSALDRTKQIALVLCSFLAGAVLFSVNGALASFFPNTPTLPLAVWTYRVSAGITSELLLGYIDVTWLGADSTGATDSTTAVAEATTLVANGGKVHFPPGAYKLYWDGSTCSPGIGNIIFDGFGAILRPVSSGQTNSTIVYINNSSCGSGAAYQQTNYKWVGFVFDGRVNGTGNGDINYDIFLNGSNIETEKVEVEYAKIAGEYGYFAQYTRDFDSLFAANVTTSYSQNVSGTQSSGGLIELTVGNTSGLTTGQIVSVVNVGGTTEANAAWPITVVDGSHITLNNSVYANAYTSGGTVTVGAWGAYFTSGGVPKATNEVAFLRSRFGSNWGGFHLDGGRKARLDSNQFQGNIGPGLNIGSDSTGQFATANSVVGAYFEVNGTDVILNGAEGTTFDTPSFGGNQFGQGNLAILDTYTWNTIVLNPDAASVIGYQFWGGPNVVYTPQLTWIGGSMQILPNTLRTTVNANPTLQALPANVFIQAGSTGQGVWLANFVHITSGTGSPNSASIGYVGDTFNRTDASGISQTPCYKTSGSGTNTGWVNAAGSSC